MHFTDSFIAWSFLIHFDFGDSAHFSLWHVQGKDPRDQTLPLLRECFKNSVFEFSPFCVWHTFTNAIPLACSTKHLPFCYYSNIYRFRHRSIGASCFHLLDQVAKLVMKCYPHIMCSRSSLYLLFTHQLCTPSVSSYS